MLDAIFYATSRSAQDNCSWHYRSCRRICCCLPLCPDHSTSGQSISHRVFSEPLNSTHIHAFDTRLPASLVLVGLNEQSASHALPEEYEHTLHCELEQGLSGKDSGIAVSGSWTPSQPTRSVRHRRREFSSQVHRIELSTNCIGDESSTVGCSGNRVMLMMLSGCCLREWGEPWLRYLLAIFRSPYELLQILRYPNMNASDYPIVVPPVMYGRSTIGEE